MQLFPRLAVLGLLLCAGCSGLSVEHDYDPSVDFSQLKTYAWPERSKTSFEDPLNHGRVVRSADNLLSTRGYELDPEAPDFLLIAHLGTQVHLRVTDWGYPPYGGPWGGPYWGGPAGSRIDVQEVERGVLVLDVIDEASKRLLWRGVAKGSIVTAHTPEKRERQIQRAVEAILARFPPE